jgi:hypothetical protein
VSPLDLAEAQLDAYNAQDLDAHCACFADDVVVADLNAEPNLRGIADYRARYEGLFAQFPQNRAELVGRREDGCVVAQRASELPALLRHIIRLSVRLGTCIGEHAPAQRRSRRAHGGLVAHLRVADAGQHIAERIVHAHGRPLTSST